MWLAFLGALLVLLLGGGGLIDRVARRRGPRKLAPLVSIWVPVACPVRDSTQARGAGHSPRRAR